jgi:hypothetical protein
LIESLFDAVSTLAVSNFETHKTNMLGGTTDWGNSEKFLTMFKFILMEHRIFLIILVTAEILHA